MESSRENLWNEIQLKGPQRQKKSQEQTKKGWASSVGLIKNHKPQHPHHVKVNPRECEDRVTTVLISLSVERGDLTGRSRSLQEKDQREAPVGS